MKRLVIMLLMCIFLISCGASARNSGFYEHDFMYKDWRHLWFNWDGYKKCTQEEAKDQSEAEGWWGFEKYCPANKSSDGLVKS